MSEFWPVIAPRQRHGRFCKLRDDGIVPVILPDCVAARSSYAAAPSRNVFAETTWRGAAYKSLAEPGADTTHELVELLAALIAYGGRPSVEWIDPVLG
jgi:hypothetical protein